MDKGFSYTNFSNRLLVNVDICSLETVNRLFWVTHYKDGMSCNRFFVFFQKFSMGLREIPLRCGAVTLKKYFHFFLSVILLCRSSEGALPKQVLRDGTLFDKRAHFCFDISCQNRYCVTVSVLTNGYIFYFRECKFN